MSKSLGDACNEIRNHRAKYEDFPAGSRVRVSTFHQDGYFFRTTETGVVQKNTGRYLGIRVKFDEPMEFEDGWVKYDHGFDPGDLRLIGPAPGRAFEWPCTSLFC